MYLTWSPLVRVDLLALFFCLFALCIVFYRWFSWRWTILAILFFLASIYTRQSYMLAGPLAAFTWLWGRDRRRAMLFASILFVAVLGLFTGIEISTQGGFSLNIIRANINRFDLGILSGMFQHFLLIWPVIILGCLGFSGLLLANHFRHRTVTPNSFIFPGLVVFCLGAFISALTVGKVGSGVNLLLRIDRGLRNIERGSYRRPHAATTFVLNRSSCSRSPVNWYGYWLGHISSSQLQARLTGTDWSGTSN